MKNKTTKQSTIIDVANKAGVSKATVGRVIGNYGNVSPKTRERVYDAIRELNYSPNAIAQCLRSQNTKTIGVIVGSIKNNFCNQLLYSVERIAIEKGYQVLFCNTSEQKNREFEHLRNLKTRRVDGVILITALTAIDNITSNQLSLYNELPLVLADRNISNLPVNFVSSNNYQSAYDITNRFIKLGHTKIGVVSYGYVSTISDRINGYIHALRDSGLPYNETQNYSVAHVEKMTQENLIEFIKRNPDMTAIIVLNNSILARLLSALAKLRKKIPDDISVVSWDDDEMNELLNIDTISQQVEEIGKIAAEKLFQIIENPAEVQTERIILNTIFKKRHSTRAI